MKTDIDEMDDIDTTRVRPIPWAKFKASVFEAWPGPPLCSTGHAKHFVAIASKMEALDLADPGEEPRAIRSTADLDIRLIRRFVDAQPPTLSPWTLKSRLSVVRSMCQFAFEHRGLQVNPFALRPMKRWVRVGRPQGKRHLTRDECRKLLDQVEAESLGKVGWARWKAWRRRVMVLIGLYCGLRRGELLRLQVSDLDIPARLIRVRPHGKSLKTERSEDSVPIPDAILGPLKEWLARWRMAAPVGFRIAENCPWMLPTVRRNCAWISGSKTSRPWAELSAVGGRAGIGHITFQMLRRTCATLLEAKGVPPATIARILRHSEQVDAQFYRQRDEDTLRAAAGDLVI
jgi:integrase